MDCLKVATIANQQLLSTQFTFFFSKLDYGNLEKNEINKYIFKCTFFAFILKGRGRGKGKFFMR